MKKTNRFLLFLTSCLSGCGQMYQGYMKRGISLLLLFFAIFVVMTFLSLTPLAFLLPVVWAYAFFDSYNLRARLEDGAAPEDAYLFGLSEMDQRQMRALLGRRHSLIGWVLVALGAYMLYDTVLDQLGWLWNSWLYSLLRYDVPRLAVTVLVIALGGWFIRGPKARREDDIPAFVPPARPEAAPSASKGGEPASERPEAEEPGAQTAPAAETEVPYDRDSQ